MLSDDEIRSMVRQGVAHLQNPDEVFVLRCPECDRTFRRPLHYIERMNAKHGIVTCSSA